MARRTKGKRRVTLADIATSAGVSTKTVSLALRGDRSVSKNTHKRIQDIAQNMGYVLRESTQKAFGLIVPYITHIPYTELLTFIRECAYTHDYITIIAESAGYAEAERKCISELGNRNVDGLILISPRSSIDDIEHIARHKCPVVTVNLPVDDNDRSSFASIEIDNEAGAYCAVKYLIDHGHRNIIHFAGRFRSASARQRRKGYINALRTLGENRYEERIIEIGGYRPDFKAGYEQCKRALSIGGNFDAIVAYNDLMALGAMRALTEHKLKIPEDVSIIGFDNIALGQFSNPPLTTVGAEAYTIANLTVDSLLTLIQEQSTAVHKIHHKLVPELTVRETVFNRERHKGV